MILGVDPGWRTGFAVIQNERLVFCKSVISENAIQYVIDLHKTYAFDIAAVEISKPGVLYQSRANRMNKQAGLTRLAMSIGQNVALSKSIISGLKSIPVKVIAVHPTKTGTKWKLDYWERIFKWGKPTNDHARDAACIAYFNENNPVFHFQGV